MVLGFSNEDPPHFGSLGIRNEVSSERLKDQKTKSSFEFFTQPARYIGAIVSPPVNSVANLVRGLFRDKELKRRTQRPD